MQSNCTVNGVLVKKSNTVAEGQARNFEKEGRSLILRKKTMPQALKRGPIILASILLFLLFSCNVESESVSEMEAPAAPSDTLVHAAEVVEEEPILPAYSDKETLLSRELDPTEQYLAMVFEEAIEDDFAQNKTHIRFYQQASEAEWALIDSVVLFEEGRKCFEIAPVVWLPMGAQAGFLLETEAGRMGNANAGLTERDYIIYVPGAKSVSTYRYEKWLREATGELSAVRQGSGDFTAFIRQSIAGASLNQPEADTFQRPWLAANEALYELMEETGIWHEIRFPVFSKALLDSFPSDNMIKTADWIVQGGFASPVLAYSRKAEKTFVLWIPAGWPNGGGWGFRSLYVEDVSPAGQITVSNRDDVHLLMDIPRQRVRFLDTLPNR